MSKRSLLAIAAIVILIMVAIPFISHRSQSAIELTKVDPAFGAYVSAYTSGTISNESYIRVTLAADYTGPVTLGKPVDETYFAFEPAISGKTYWLDTRTLEFRPDERLPSDQAYNAELFLDKLITDLPKDMRTMKFGFHTMKQNFEVSVDGMKTTDKTTLRKQQLRGTLLTVDAADKATVEQVLTVMQDGKSLAVRWEHESDNVTHRFTVDNVVRAEKQGKVVVSWDGKPLHVDQKKSTEIIIPALNDFKVMDVRVEQGQEQCVVVSFSDPIAEKQNLDGLISLKEGSGLRYSVEDNDVKVYPADHLSGDYTINVSQGVKNIIGKALPNAFTKKITFEELKPAVEIVGNGVILPNSGRGLLFPFKAVSLKAIDVKIVRIYESNIPQFLQVNALDGRSELYRVGKVVVRKKIDLNVKSQADYGRWMNYSLDMGELIKSEPGAIYRVSIGFRKEYSVYTCTDTSSVRENEEEDYSYRNRYDEMTADEENESYGYYGDYYEDTYYWDRGNEESPCDNNYYYGRTKSRNILASDLGLLAKRGNDGSLLFAVNDLITTKPVKGATLEVYDFQQQLLTTIQSDADGMAKLNLPKKKPFLLIAKNGNQRGYLKMDDGASLSVSAFDVSGEMVQKGLKGYIYGERGVWRPGDTLFLGFILEDKQKLLPATHPVTFDLYNARGQQVSHVIKSQSVNGFYTFITPTDPDAPTGNWTARIKVGGATFTKDVKVETIMPNRLKININFGAGEVLTESKDQKVILEARWLHGAIAKNLKAQVDVSMSKTTTKFKGYDNYVFDDPATNFSTESKIVFDSRLDENGRAEFSPELSGEGAPGMLKASFNTRVFEEGGAFSSDRFSVNYSPYESYVGVLVPRGEGWGGMLETNKDWNVRVATVDKNGKPVSRQKVKVQVYKVDWSWWWDSDDENLARYVSNDYYSPYLEQEISTKNGLGQFRLNIKNEDYGRFLVRVTDEESGHSSGMVTWFDWPYWNGSGTKNNDIASLLQFTSDKTKYNVGETMNLTIPSPGQGRALITLENGSKILSASWVETAQKGNINYAIPITSEMAPNVYVNVTLIQPHGQVKNDAPIRLYGVIPVTVDDPKTHIDPVITTSAATWRPEETAAVTVSEKNGKAMTYTLAIVDEGLLDLTRFKTPDPWENFYAREALGVKSWDMYDMVMGAYGAEMSRVLGIGGDGSETDRSGQKANRFKPMVKFMGPFELKAGERKVHTFMMPQYVGSVRVMVIAGQDNAYGSAEKAVPVRKPLMILGTLPRVVGPGETVDLPVNVFAMEKKVKNVNVTVASTKGLINVVDGATKSTSFKEVGDNIVMFRMKVADAIGMEKIVIRAEGGGEKAVYTIEIDVRNPNPKMTNAFQAVIDPGQTWSSDYTPIGVAGTNAGVLEVSTIPPLNLGQRLDYLISYPHGCIEQTTSSVFPQLFLSDLLKLDNEKKNEVDRNIKAGIDRLRSFQTSSGGLSYWPGDHEASEWGSNYAGHFLLEAEAKGYTLPGGFIDNWKRYQRTQAINWSPRNDRTYYSNDDLIQAYRLYTLALAKAPELGAMNRLREVKSLSVSAQWRLAAAYQLAGQPEIAKQLVTGISTTIPEYRELAWSFGSSERDEAMILETVSLMDMRAKGAPIAKRISDDLNNSLGWMSTQTTAYCLIALCKFSSADKMAGGTTFDYTVNRQSGKVSAKEPVSQIDMQIRDTKTGKVTVKNTGKNTLFVRVVLEGIPAAGNETDASDNLGMDVQFTSIYGTQIDPSKIDQGTDFIATVTITNPGLRGDYHQMALTQIFPSGWEIRNVRMEEGANTVASSSFDYQDIRDDRVYTYFSLYPRRANTYRVQLNAAYSGHFYLPAFYCEAMYDHTINARRAGRWVDVVPAGSDLQ